MPHSHIAIIGAPLDLGQGRRGVDMGPSAIRMANLNRRVAGLGYTVEDLGNVEVALPETAAEGSSHAKYLPEIASTCGRLAATVGQALGRGRLPVALGGDHSVAIGTTAGVSRFFRETNQKVGIIWL